MTPSLERERERQRETERQRDRERQRGRETERDGRISEDVLEIVPVHCKGQKNLSNGSLGKPNDMYVPI